jgi:two-component system sensor histidine kinase AlgZ
MTRLAACDEVFVIIYILNTKLFNKLKQIACVIAAGGCALTREYPSESVIRRPKNSMQRIESPTADPAQLIPDFCRARTILLLAFAMEMITIVFTLASTARGEAALFRLVLLSLYLQWIGLCSAALLCWSRRWLGVTRPSIVFLLAWALLVLVSVGISAVAYEVCSVVPVLPNFPDETRGAFVLRSAIIDAIVSLLLLRYFWLRQQWRGQVQAEGESRYQALSARIQPHFLFNSLNSIAALIAIRPREAETLVVDLSDLFRASMKKQAERVPLSEEIALVKAYLRIEQVRMGQRMRVEWDVPDELLNWRVPMLVIQPLVENAVHHGISRLREPGTLVIRICERQRRLIVEVENPIPPDGTETAQGNRIAIDNIVQRLQLIYGGSAQLELGREGKADVHIFRARLTLPMTAQSPAAGAAA